MSTAYELHDLTFAWGNREVLNLDRLGIAGGRVSAIVGPNGAGKSTLLRLLAFCDMPSGGTLRFFGEPVQGTPLQLRRRVAMVPQDPYLLRENVFRNAETGLRLRRVPAAERRERVEAALSQLGLLRHAERPASELSGGEKQKLAVARALVLEPDVLLLDEPFAFLDERTATELRSLLTRIGEHGAQTVLFTTHNLALAHELATEVHSLVKGRRHGDALLNLFHGRMDLQAGMFDTGRIRIPAANCTTPADLVTIDPNAIVLSRADTAGTARGLLEARVIGLARSGDGVQISLDLGGETLQLLRDDARLDGRPLELDEMVLIRIPPGSVHPV